MLEHEHTHTCNNYAQQYPGKHNDYWWRLPDALGAGPLIAMQQCGAEAGSRRKEGKVHADDHHDDRNFKSDTDIGAVA